MSIIELFPVACNTDGDRNEYWNFDGAEPDQFVQKITDSQRNEDGVANIGNSATGQLHHLREPGSR